MEQLTISVYSELFRKLVIMTNIPYKFLKNRNVHGFVYLELELVLRMNIPPMMKLERSFVVRMRQLESMEWYFPNELLPHGLPEQMGPHTVVMEHHTSMKVLTMMMMLGFLHAIEFGAPAQNN